MSSESPDSKQTETAPNLVRRENSPGAISDNTGNIAQGGSATINDRTALYIAILALVIAALCLGLFLMQTVLMPQLVETTVQARVAKAEAEANEAKVTARVAAKEVTTLCASLKAAHVKNVDCH